MFFFSGSRRDKINVEKYDELLDCYKLKNFSKEKIPLWSILLPQSRVNGRIDSMPLIELFPYGSDTSSADTQHRLVCLEQSACLCLWRLSSTSTAPFGEQSSKFTANLRPFLRFKKNIPQCVVWYCRRRITWIIFAFGFILLCCVSMFSAYLCEYMLYEWMSTTVIGACVLCVAVMNTQINKCNMVLFT